QYWSYIDSMLSKSSGKRLNGPICGIGSIGAVLGGWALSLLSERWGTLTMVLLAAAVTLPAILLSEAVFRRYGEPRPREDKQAETTTDHLGLKLFSQNRMLVLLICLIAATQVMATVLDLSFRSLLQDSIPNADAQNAYSGRFWLWLNGIAMPV